MAIDPVSNSSVNSVSPAKAAGLVQQPKQDANEVAAVYEKSAEEPAGKIYSRDTVKKMNLELDARYAGLKSLVEKLLSKQSAKAGQSAGLSFEEIQKKYDGNLKEFFENLQVDAATKLQAQQDISEDGYWGVKQTSQRLIDFAIGLSGGDKTKLEELKKAIEKGFSNAERAWGGSLPSICMQTKDAVMKGLDDWASENS